MLSIWMFIISVVQADELIRTATWEHVPAIEICPDSPVTKEEHGCYGSLDRSDG